MYSYIRFSLTLLLVLSILFTSMPVMVWADEAPPIPVMEEVKEKAPDTAPGIKTPKPQAPPTPVRNNQNFSLPEFVFGALDARDAGGNRIHSLERILSMMRAFGVENPKPILNRLIGDYIIKQGSGAALEAIRAVGDSKGSLAQAEQQALIAARARVATVWKEIGYTYTPNALTNWSERAGHNAMASLFQGGENPELLLKFIPSEGPTVSRIDNPHIEAAMKQAIMEARQRGVFTPREALSLITRKDNGVLAWKMDRASNTSVQALYEAVNNSYDVWEMKNHDFVRAQKAYTDAAAALDTSSGLYKEKLGVLQQATENANLARAVEKAQVEANKPAGFSAQQRETRFQKVLLEALHDRYPTPQELTSMKSQEVRRLTFIVEQEAKLAAERALGDFKKQQGLWNTTQEQLTLARNEADISLQNRARTALQNISLPKATVKSGNGSWASRMKERAATVVDGLKNFFKAPAEPKPFVQEFVKALRGSLNPKALAGEAGVGALLMVGTELMFKYDPSDTEKGFLKTTSEYLFSPEALAHIGVGSVVGVGVGVGLKSLGTAVAARLGQGAATFLVGAPAAFLLPIGLQWQAQGEVDKIDAGTKGTEQNLAAENMKSFLGFGKRAAGKSNRIYLAKEYAAVHRITTPPFWSTAFLDTFRDQLVQRAKEMEEISTSSWTSLWVKTTKYESKLPVSAFVYNPETGIPSLPGVLKTTPLPLEAWQAAQEEWVRNERPLLRSRMQQEQITGVAWFMSHYAAFAAPAGTLVQCALKAKDTDELIAQSISTNGALSYLGALFTPAELRTMLEQKGIALLQGKVLSAQECGQGEPAGSEDATIPDCTSVRINLLNQKEEDVVAYVESLSEQEQKVLIQCAPSLLPEAQNPS